MGRTWSSTAYVWYLMNVGDNEQDAGKFSHWIIQHPEYRDFNVAVREWQRRRA